VHPPCLVRWVHVTEDRRMPYGDLVAAPHGCSVLIHNALIERIGKTVYHLYPSVENDG
jgi:hypothetical protein